MRTKILVGLLAAFSLSAPVFANPTLSRDSDGNLYVAGLAPGAEYELTFPNADKIRTVVANACGALLVRYGSGTPLPSSFSYRVTGTTTAGTSVNPSELPVGLVPTCTNGQWDVAPTVNFRTSSNTIVIIGVTPNVSHQIVTQENRTRKAKANACGFARYANGTANPIPAVVIADGSSVTVANLPDRPLLCRNGRTFAPVVTQTQ
jgi:hypothetical protein